MAKDSLKVEKVLVAVLDNEQKLVGMTKIDEPANRPSDLVFLPDECDLPTDGTYKYDWENAQFVPLGHGFGKPEKQPVADSRVMYLLIKEMQADGKSHPELTEWATWYEKTLSNRDAEMRMVHLRRSGKK